MKWSQAIAINAVVIIGFGVVNPGGTLTEAQIIPDSTLPINSDIKFEQNRLIIRGGTAVGSNLFHSFSEFNVEAGGGAYFTNPAGIENILSRVTGNNPSTILGTLGVLGNANLFLINPNGILFDRNAKLNINGSFIASTANRLLFADGNEFSTAPTQDSPLLTVSTPIGLGLVNGSAGIRIEGEGHQLKALNFLPITDNSVAGLKVHPGRTLAFIGGKIDLDGAILTALDGHIVLAAVNEGEVRFSSVQEGKFDFQNIAKLANISLPQLNLIEGGGLLTVSYSIAKAGSLNLNIPGTLNIVGYSPRSARAASTINSIAFSDGAAGDITIDAGKLSIQSGGLLLSATVGKGNGGTIQITTNTLEVLGSNPAIVSPSAIGSSSAGKGNAASVNIQTDRLTVEHGGKIDSSTLAQGSAGTIFIKATDYVSLSNKDSQSKLSSSIVSSADILNPLFRNSFNLPDGSQLSGESGTIKISSPRIYIDDHAFVRTTNLGTGNAGSIVLSGKLIRLTNGGSLSAETQSGAGGNIKIAANTLLLRQSQISATAQNAGNGGNITTNSDNLVLIDSRIAADAFRGSGGNVAIATQGLFVNPQSQISASSELGVDGEVEIAINEPGVGEGLIEVEPSLASEVNISISCIGQNAPNRTQLTLSGGRSLPMSPGVGISEWAIPTPGPVAAPTPPPLQEANAIIKRRDGRLLLGYVAPVTYRSAQELVCDDSS